MLHSLRSQFLIPLSLAMLVTGTVVSGMAYWIAAKSAKSAIEKRLQSVSTIACDAAFPLTAKVLEQMRSLSSLELAVLQSDGRRIIATDGLTNFRQLDLASIRQAMFDAEVDETSRAFFIAHQQSIAGQRYDVAVRRLETVAAEDGRRWVAVLSPHAAQQQLRQQAALLPIVTGGLATLVIGCVATLLASRIRKKIAVLRRHVGRLAEGSMESLPVSETPDEIGELTIDINHMAQQMDELQTAIRSNQRATLINQVASGMAHQLRNTLTGARLAIQVYQRNHPHEPADDLGIAIDQLKLAEQSIQSLLQVRTGVDEQPTPPLSIGELVSSIRSLVQNKADHKGIELQMALAAPLAMCRVPDGQTILGALLNLMLNAIEAAPEKGQVSFEATLVETAPSMPTSASTHRQTRCCRFSIIDSGSGPAANIAAAMFEPFTTTKPEGIGLGLPMAKRTSQRWGGDVAWKRVDERTEFVFSIPLLADEDYESIVDH